MSQPETWTGPSGTEYEIIPSEDRGSCWACELFWMADSQDCQEAPCKAPEYILRRKGSA